MPPLDGLPNTPLNQLYIILLTLGSGSAHALGSAR